MSSVGLCNAMPAHCVIQDSDLELVADLFSTLFFYVYQNAPSLEL